MLARLARRVLPLVLVVASVFLSSWVDTTEARGGGSVHVRGYYRKDGTYVQPHYRSAPDGNFYNNWSTRGNVNPYTGEPGTKVSPPSGYGQDVYVRGYYRSDGTYVPPHFRSPPDGDPSNNWTAEGNLNPYTGEPGTKHDDAADDATSSTTLTSPEPALQPVFSLQAALLLCGHDPGPLDNIIGRKTKAAFVSYIRANGLGRSSLQSVIEHLSRDVRRTNPAISNTLDGVAAGALTSGSK